MFHGTLAALETLLVSWLALIGLSVGSFLNVVIARLPEGLSVVSPRSRCPKCGHQLPWYENVPVLSWLLLRGRCSGCKVPISPRYVLVELLTGTLFVAALARFDWTWPLVAALVFLSVLVPLIFIDAEHWVLPFELTLPGLGAVLLVQLASGVPAFQTALIGAVAAFLCFRVIEFLGWAVVGREALGAGDKYLMALVGATLGWRPLLGVVFLSALQGSVYGVVRMRLTGRAGAPLTPEAHGDAASAEPEAPGRDPWTPAFLMPGLPLWKRLVLVPYAVLLQDIPDPPPVDETTGEEPDWVPGASNLPFGPWIGLAAVEVLLLRPWLVGVLGSTQLGPAAEVMFGAL